MAKEEAKTPDGEAPKGVSVQLVPTDQSAQPILANYTGLNPSPGIVLVDFGFLKPAALAALSQLARSGKKMPERLNGRLAARVALPYDALANFHQQVGRLLQAIARQSKAAQ